MEKKQTYHSMKRRAAAHDYSRPGIYHITLHVAEELGQPLGTVVPLKGQTGDAESSDATVALSPIGTMVKEELLQSITACYPMVNVQDYVIMPEHLHFLLVVQDRILSSNGKTQPIGHLIAGFKQGCNRRYWKMMTQRAEPVATLNTPTPAPVSANSCTAPVPVNTTPGPESANSASSAQSAVSVSDGSAVRKQSLFSNGYCDVMPVDAAQLETQRAYIRNNPRNRWLRMHNPDWLKPHRSGIDTALTPSALRGYLQRECPLSADDFALIERRLLLTPTSAQSAVSVSSGFAAGMEHASITCDSYGDRALLTKKLLPVVCHRKDIARFHEQKDRCLAEAAQGAVLVSARIAKSEQAIIDEAIDQDFPVVLITDNGFPERYHPSQQRFTHCAEGRMLLVTPWQYQYRGKDDSISVAFCKTMNCVAQALCRLRDDWWKQNTE